MSIKNRLEKLEDKLKLNNEMIFLPTFEGLYGGDNLYITSREYSRLLAHNNRVDTTSALTQSNKEIEKIIGRLI